MDLVPADLPYQIAGDDDDGGEDPARGYFANEGNEGDDDDDDGGGGGRGRWEDEVESRCHAPPPEVVRRLRESPDELMLKPLAWLFTKIQHTGVSKASCKYTVLLIPIINVQPPVLMNLQLS